jgi:hypothetical protein
MTKIYVDTPTCADHLKLLGPIEICNSLDDNIDYAIFHLPYPLSQDNDFRNRLIEAVKKCQHVSVLVSELHSETVKFIREHQHPRISYFICGFIKNLETKKWMDWLHRSSDFYRHNTQILDQLDPYSVKSKTFDILLGRSKPHRSTVYNFIKKNNLDDRVIMTYLKGQDNIPLQAQDQSGWIWEPGVVQLTNEFKWTVTPIRYQNTGMSLSQVVPISIYAQTAYSIVTETNYDNDYSFFTEKIVKPVLAERLFVVFSGQYYLRNLRSVGFKTFDSIIDETYDSVADNNQRFSLACEQIKYLINQPQEDILAKIRHITEHNKQVMLETDWYGDFSKELRAVLLDRTS